MRFMYVKYAQSLRREKIMKISQEGIDLIKSFEGLRLKAYKALPTEKYFTIGYGHYGEDVKEGMTITQKQAEDLLKKDLERYERYVDKYAGNLALNQHERDALVSFCYNCGAGNLKKLCKDFLAFDNACKKTVVSVFKAVIACIVLPVS